MSVYRESSSLETLLDAGLVQQLRRIELRTRRVVDADLLGSYRSAFRGSGMLFSDLREYEPGDDVKSIHWKASARSGKVYVKSYEEERQLNVLLTLDVSSSTACGGPRSKHDRAREFAALISVLARLCGDALGLCLYGEGVLEFLPARAARSQFQAVMLRLLAERRLRPGSDTAGALRAIAERQRRRAVIFLLSDFFCPPFEEELRRLAARHDVICALLSDPADAQPPAAGIVEFIDAESGERCTRDLSREARRVLSEAHAGRVSELQALCRRSGADLLVVAEHPLQELARLMRERARRAGR